ncbi:uncharacterized protein LOC107044001 [Diachasma alloeum]|uniref:uncharacterized protein LOC107044001 n=1 Tax=Diachasma alloeum TaxID=454923 RepID=UPI0007383ED4|nr:uncharacterized protein LOC107044001 [Diachasma alloeum]
MTIEERNEHIYLLNDFAPLNSESEQTGETSEDGEVLDEDQFLGYKTNPSEQTGEDSGTDDESSTRGEQVSDDDIQNKNLTGNSDKGTEVEKMRNGKDEGFEPAKMDDEVDGNSKQHSMVEEDDRNSRSERRSDESDELDLQSRLRMHHVLNARELLFSRTATYPENFERTHQNIRGFPLDWYDLETLKPGTELSDNILNAFAAMLVDTARETRRANVLFINTSITGNLILNKLHERFKRNLVRRRLSGVEYWILPLHLLTRNHWTLMIVDAKNHMLVLIDSMRRKLPSLHLFHANLTLVNMLDPEMAQSDPPSSNYCPSDVPDQNDLVSCGIHACLWMYIICTSLPIECDHEDTLFARAGITRMLMENPVAETAESIERIPIHKELLDT